MNLHKNASGFSPRTFFRYWKYDRKSLKVINLADHVVFQSHFQKSFFQEAGVKNPNFSVIYNGAIPRLTRND